MSTDLYGLRVEHIEGSKVTLKVLLVYYDWDSLPEARTFFLRALWDEADTRFGGGGPLGDAISVDDICDEDFVGHNTWKFIRSVERTGTRNHPIDRRKDYATFYYLRDGGWKDEDELVQGTYVVEMTDPRWTQHLSLGQTWASTAYETREVPHPLTAAEAGPVDFAGKVVVVTGTLPRPRAEVHRQLKALGATVGKGITAKTDCLIAGEKAGSKATEAVRRSLPIYAPDVLDAVIAGAGELTLPPPEPKKPARKPRPVVASSVGVRELPRLSDAHAALVKALHRSEVGKVEAELSSGLDPNVAFGNGDPLLTFVLCQRFHKPSTAKRMAIVRALLAAGADPNVTNPKNKSFAGIPLFLALDFDWMSRVVPDLLDHGASMATVEPRNGWTALHLAASKQSKPQVERALQTGTPASCVDRDGNTPLHLVLTSVFESKTGPMVKMLLAAGADASAANAKGERPVHLAAQHRPKSVVAALVKAGADLEIRTGAGDTTLHCAAMGKRSGSMSKVDEIATLQWLVSKTPYDLSVTNDAGDTLLHCAVRSGSDRMVKWLVQEGLALDATNAAGERPVELCKRKKLVGLLTPA